MAEYRAPDWTLVCPPDERTSLLPSLTTETDRKRDQLVPGLLSRRKAGWWAGKAFWAVLDRALFAISNFAVGILLARWLSPQEFGSFAVAQSAFLLAGTLHAALFSEPMVVFGSARHAERFSRYLDILLHTHWRMAGLSSLLLACAAFILWFAASPVAGAFLGAAMASPFILFGWMVRRACFSRLQPQWAAMGGALYLLLLLTGCYLLRLVDLLSAFSALVLFGAAGLISGRWVLGRLRDANTSPVGAVLSHSEVLRDHWSYGRWALASNGLSWIPSNLCYILLPTFAGVEAAGALKAIGNLVMPVLQFNGALAALLVPALASAAGKRSEFNRLVAAGLTVFAGGSLLYWGLLTVLGDALVKWLYRGAYGDTAALMPILSVLPLFAACTGVFASALRALERPQPVFWAYAVSTGVTVTVGVWFIAAWGLTGAAVGLLLSSAITAALCGAFLVGTARNGSRYAEPQHE